MRLTMMKVFGATAIATIAICILTPAYAFLRPYHFETKILSSSRHSESQETMNWDPLSPSKFDTVFRNGRQWAKDEGYLNAVVDLWKSEEMSISVESSPFIFHCEETPLYGHLVRRSTSQSSTMSVPGILLFHTAAGPQDVSLFFKAASLLQSFDCVVFICDILSDETGWAWGPDRTKYSSARESLIKDNALLLNARVAATVRALTSRKDIHVDSKRLAGIGWCLGGQPIMELGRTGEDVVVKAMITFHGVFHRKSFGFGALQQIDSDSEVLIANGADDPFVSEEDLQDVKRLFESQGFTVNLLQLEGARHGFSNPAQALNGSPAFDYSESAANKSWKATLELLQRALFQ